MSGVNEFKLELSVMDIVDITDRCEQALSTEGVKQLFDKGLSLEDLRTAEVLAALQQFMRDRHVEPGFEVVVGE